jgi:hypothetical protein
MQLSCILAMLCPIQKNSPIMKNVLASVLFLFIGCMSYAQHASIDQFYDKYKDLENVSTVNLQGWLLNLVASAEEDEEMESLSAKITDLRLLVMEESNMVSKKEYRQLKRNVLRDRYEELIQIREGGDVIDFMLREKGDHITDVLILVNSNDKFVLLNIAGQLRFSDLNDLDIQVEGGDLLQKLPDNRKDVPRA